MYCALIVIVTGLHTFTAYDMKCSACQDSIKFYMPMLLKASKVYKKNPITVECKLQEGV